MAFSTFWLLQTAFFGSAIWKIVVSLSILGSATGASNLLVRQHSEALFLVI